MPSVNRANPVIVGAFVVSGMALAIAVIFLFGARHLFSPTVQAVVYFPGSVANLDVGAPVTFRGVRVGAVTRVAVSLNMKDLTARIPVYLDLDPSQIVLQDSRNSQRDGAFQSLLKAGLRAQLNMQSLITGQLRVDLDIMPGSRATIYGGASDRFEIPSIPSKLQTLEDEIAALPLVEIAENTRQALVALRQAADTLAPAIGTVVDSVKTTSEAARVTLADVDTLSVEAHRQMMASGSQIGVTLRSTDLALRDIDALMISLKEMTSADSPMRSDLLEATRDLSDSASSLRGFTHAIERDPSTLLFGRIGR